MVTFKNADISAKGINDIKKIKDLFYNQGFVVVNGNSLLGEKKERVILMANLLNLGNINNSKYNEKYFSKKINEEELNIIGRVANAKGKIKHEKFEENIAQELHVDGTFLPIGSVKTMILYCQNPAIEGGESILFNVIGAIKEIEKTESIEPFFDKNALRRVSSYKGIKDEHTDAIIANDINNKNKLMIRFANDSTVDWSHGLNKVIGLKKPLSKLLKLTKNSQYNLKFKLKKDEMIIVNNNLLAHGRESFIDTEKNPRIMIRGVYKNFPR